MTKYNIHLASKAERDLKKLPPKIKPQIIEKIRQLETDRHPPQFKALVGKNVAQFRLRIGDYRVIYDVYDSDRVVLIFRIGHRRNIYR